MKEIIANGNFELWCNPTWPLYWEVSNIAGASDIAYSGCWSVKLSPCPGSTLLQTVAVEPDTGYQLSYYLKCMKGEALVAARVEWLDSNGCCLQLGGEQISELADQYNSWMQYRLILPAIPEHCSWARISFAARGGQILLDEVSLNKQ